MVDDLSWRQHEIAVLTLGVELRGHILRPLCRTHGIRRLELGMRLGGHWRKDMLVMSLR